MLDWIDKLGIAIVLWAVILLTALAVRSMFAQQPVLPGNVERKPLTPVGKLAVKAMHQEITQVNQDIQALLAAELEAQHLKDSDGWFIELETDQLARRVPPKPAEPIKPGEKPPDKPK